jgi:hypothetical protein
MDRHGSRQPQTGAHQAGHTVIVEMHVVAVLVSDVTAAQQEGEVLSCREVQNCPCSKRYIVNVLVIGSVGRNEGALGLKLDFRHREEAEAKTGASSRLSHSQTLVEITDLAESAELEGAKSLGCEGRCEHYHG